MAATTNPNLRPCPDCEAMVSKRAESCPQCGAPLAEIPDTKPEAKTDEINLEFSAANRIPQAPRRLSDSEQNRIWLKLGFFLIIWLIAVIGCAYLYSIENYAVMGLIIGCLFFATVAMAIFELMNRPSSRGASRSGSRRRLSQRPAKPVSAKDKYRG